MTTMSDLINPGSCPKRTAISGMTLLLLTLSFGVLAAVRPTDANAQNWRRKTPRDTIRVNANSPSWIQSKMSLSTGLDIQAVFKGTFGMFSGKTGTGFDARYTYEQPPGWAAPIPLLNPPSFNNQSHNVYVAWTNKSLDLNGIGEPIKVQQTAYQNNHVYTGLYPSLGIPLNFKIMAGDGKPNSYYSNGSGGITIELAQWTAGVAMRSKTLSFGTVNIGESVTIKDSIASYGIDPLQVDSFRVLTSSTPAVISKDFTVTSQRGPSFTLPNEAVNEFLITFSPSTRGTVLAFLYIYCKNTDGPNRIKVVQLQGAGAAPSIAIGPKKIDFGKVRIDRSGTGYVNIANGGNGALIISQTTYSGDNVFTGSLNAPIEVPPGGARQIIVTFKPTAVRAYRGVLTIKGSGVPTDSVVFTGEGAQPGLTYSDTVIQFGSVRRNDNSIRYLTIKNTGSLTANVLNMQLTGPNRSSYSLEPDPQRFLLSPGDSMRIQIKFEPTTGPAGARTAYIEVSQDDGRPPKSILLIGYEVEPEMFLGRTLIDFGNVKIGVTKRDTVTMFNSSNAELNVFDVRRIGPLPDNNMFGHNTDWPKILKARARDTLRVTFTPTDRGQFSTWLHTNVNGLKDSVFLTGRGVWPKSAFAPHDLDYGTVPSNMSSTMVTVLRDTGDYRMEVCSVEVIGDDKSYFKLKHTNPQLPATLIENGTGMNIAVEFKTNDQTGRSYFAWLKVIYCDGSADSIRLIAREQRQMLEFGQRTVDFGKIRVKSTLTKPAQLSNGSNVKLSAGQVFITGTPQYFTIPVTSAEVQPKTVDSLQVTFAPLTRGDFTGYLHATGGDIATDSILLKGIGASPEPKMDTLIDFGTTIIPNQTVRNLRIENLGNWMLKGRITIVNDQYGEFTITMPSTSDIDSIEEGGVRDYPITFKPKTPQLIHTAEVKLVLDDSSTYLTKLVALDEALYVNIDSPRVDFGKVRVPTTQMTQVHLVNTSGNDRFAENVTLEQAGTEFTVNPLGRIDVNSRSFMPIDVSFRPTAIGDFTALIVATGGDIEGIDTVYLTGTGAMPVPTLKDQTLDFGTLVIGDGRTLPTSVTNGGNWIMHVTDVQVVGPNQNDFTFDLATDTTISEGDSRAFNVSFIATTPLQTDPRTAVIIFTLDDGTQFSMALIARDKMPVPTDISFGQYYARPGDKVHAILKLKTPIPNEIKTSEITGSIEFDATLVDLLTVEKYGLMEPSEWSLDTAGTRTPGAFGFRLHSESSEIHETGALLRFIFQAKKDLDRTTQTPLRLLDMAYPDTREVVAAVGDGVIIIDSSCGATHLIMGTESPKSFISQNVPNPVGLSSGQTETVFRIDIGSNGAIATLRILDASGREVARPLDRAQLPKGPNDVKFNVSGLGSGTYMYEFLVDGQAPVMKKMIVRD
jgi:hypothetical protein